jgi:hypothetical protein
MNVRLLFNYTVLLLFVGNLILYLTGLSKPVVFREIDYPVFLILVILITWFNLLNIPDINLDHLKKYDPVNATKSILNRNKVEVKNSQQEKIDHCFDWMNAYRAIELYDFNFLKKHFSNNYNWDAIRENIIKNEQFTFPAKLKTLIVLYPLDRITCTCRSVKNEDLNNDGIHVLCGLKKRDHVYLQKES